MRKLLYIFIFSITLSSTTSIFATADQQIIGTQAIAPSYRFTKDDGVVEAAKRILEMGSTMIKISANNKENLQAVLAMPFDTYFFLWRSDASIWYHGLSDANKQIEYRETYNFAKSLLLENAKQKRTFF